MFCNPRAAGELAVARLLTVTRTCQLQQINVLSYLSSAICCHVAVRPLHHCCRSDLHRELLRGSGYPLCPLFSLCPLFVRCQYLSTAPKYSPFSTNDPLSVLIRYPRSSER